MTEEMTTAAVLFNKRCSFEKASLFKKTKTTTNKQKKKLGGGGEQDHPTQVSTFYKMLVSLLKHMLNVGVVCSFAAFLSPVCENGET